MLSLRFHLRSLILVLVLLLAAPTATYATFHSFRIESVYSNADGSVQYVVLREMQALIGQRFFAGHALTSTHAALVKTFTFPFNLPSDDTANRRVLIGTQGFADLHLVAPDYVVPNQFLATDGGTLDYAGVDQITYAALPTDGSSALSRAGAGMPNLAVNFVGASAVVPPLAVGAVEYYNASLDHYFMSDLEPDIDALDSGRIAGWVRTGESFRVYPSPLAAPANVNPVCRFYIPPAHGNSHFFSASPSECAAVQAKVATDPNYSGYVFESASAFYVGLPDTTSGACANNWAPVFRLWNQRADSNHRYTTSPSVKAQMVAKAYVPEGYGAGASIMCAPLPGFASIRFLQGSAAPDGALVSDATAVATANYQSYSTPTDTVVVGPRTGAGEVIAFSSRRAVAVQQIAWTSGAGDQIVSVPLPAELAVPITIWVVAGPYATTQQTALTLWSTAQQIYFDERMGVAMPLEVVDATSNVRAASWNAFTCGAGNANLAALQADIGARPGRLNVYLVNLVDGSTSRGNACAVGGSFVAIAAGSGAELLAHELGHDLALEHIDDLTSAFNTTNVMHPASNSRLYLSEGQILRAHLRSASAVNALLGLRPGLVTRDCDRDTLTLVCPAISKRVWPDGAYPAN
ncbi:MAG: hypothetical protein M3Z31_03425 [Pseudomonadota bacterium]|nr:hypothetical protein [Pseudomonadota bacterium]